MKKSVLCLAGLLFLMIISLSSQNIDRDCLDGIYNKLKSHQPGKCGYSAHKYSVWIIDRQTRSDFYGDSIAPLYGKVEFRKRIADRLNAIAVGSGYDTLDYYSKIEDVKLVAVYNFDCCPDFAIAKYKSADFWGYLFVGYVVQADSIYILSEGLGQDLKSNYSDMITECRQFIAPDMICAASLFLSLKYAMAVPVILNKEKDLIPALIEQHRLNIKIPAVVSSGNLYYYEPYEQADSSKKIYYDLYLANDDYLREEYNDVIKMINKKGLSITPPELRQGSDADTVILTVYHTTNQHLAWWYVVFDKAGLLDTLIAHDYLYISGEQFDFLKSKSDE